MRFDGLISGCLDMMRLACLLNLAGVAKQSATRLRYAGNFSGAMSGCSRSLISISTVSTAGCG